MPEPTAFTFDQRGAKRIVDTVRTTERAGSLSAMNKLGGFSGSILLAKLTSRDSTDPRLYAWEQYRANDADFETMPGGLTGTIAQVPAMDIGGSNGADLTDSMVMLTPGVYSRGGTNNSPCFQILTQRSTAGVQYVTLLRTAGDDGSLNVAPTGTYRANFPDGTLIGDGYSPLMQRLTTRVSPATHGLGYFDNTGTFILVWCDETPLLTIADYVTYIGPFSDANFAGFIGLTFDNP